MKPKLSCREVTRLLLLAEERRLSLPERMAVRFHLLICTGCTNFERQVQLMRRATAQWRHYSDE
jgi:hypothetical protein